MREAVKKKTKNSRTSLRNDNDEDWQTDIRFDANSNPAHERVRKIG